MSKQSSLNVYITIHCHIWTFIFLCMSTSRDKMILLVLNILGESLKITAVVTVLSLLLPLDLAQKPRNTFGIPQVKESMVNRDVFLRNWYWETRSHAAPWNALWMKTSQGQLVKQLGSPRQTRHRYFFSFSIKEFSQPSLDERTYRTLSWNS